MIKGVPESPDDLLWEIKHTVDAMAAQIHEAHATLTSNEQRLLEIEREIVRLSSEIDQLRDDIDCTP